MKKFLFFIILLIVLGGAGFFLGWTQLTVPPGSYGVLRTKTHGLDSTVIQDGDFRWLWYKMIPTNAEVSVFTLLPVRRSFRSSGALSSGQIYAEAAGLNADFSWEISGDLGFKIRPEYLPEMVARENISDDDSLRIIEGNLASRIENLIIQGLRAYTDDEDRLESIVFVHSLPELSSEIERSFPEIENLVITINVLRFPDFALYQSLRALYQEFLAFQNAILSEDIFQEAERRINTRIRLEELAQYGELLTRYPILLEYIALEQQIARSGTVE